MAYRKVRNLVLFFSLIIGFSNVSAQDIVKSVSLIWQDPAIEKVSDEQTISFLRFENCVIDPSRGLLPVYIGEFEVSGATVSVEAQIINPQYKSIAHASLNLNSERISSLPFVKADVVVQNKKASGLITVMPIRATGNGNFEALTSFDVIVKVLPVRAANVDKSALATNSVLNTGSWYRIAVASDGVYKLDYNFLKAIGVDMTNFNTANLRVFGNGGGMLPYANSMPRTDDLAENAIYISDQNGNGIFDQTDYALFYGQGQTRWTYTSADKRFHHAINEYTDTTYYFVTANQGAGLRISTVPVPGAPANKFVNTFDDYAVHHYDKINFLKSGRQFFGETFDILLQQTFNFSFPNIDFSTPVYIKTRAVARTFAASSMNVRVSGSNVMTLNFTDLPGGPGCYWCEYAKSPINSDTTSFSTSLSNFAVDLIYNPSGSVSTAWLDYMELNARRQLKMSGNQMMIRDLAAIGAGNIAEYTLARNSTSQSITIWDVSNPTAPVLVPHTTSGLNAIFKTDASSLREYALFTTSGFPTPISVGPVANQDLHAMTQANMIIVAPPVFMSEAQRLAEFHRNVTNLTVHLVTPQQIYNEFSSGAQQAQAIRDFMKMFYDRATTSVEQPRFLLLFGDGSYDNKTNSASNTNFIPTYQSLNSLWTLSSYVSDDFYGNLDDTEGDWDVTIDASDVGVGRLPVRSLTEARNMVNKIIHYSSPAPQQDFDFEYSSNGYRKSPFGDWRNVVCFVGDDEDLDLHLDQANTLADTLWSRYRNYNIDKIYLDAYPQESTPGGHRYPGVKEALNKRVERGALIINYTGHGGELGWAHERILDNTDINSWTNWNNMPAFFTATCEFSRFDDPARVSAGEYVLLNSKGGGIALFTTVRLVYATPNFALNRDFVNLVFEPDNGNVPFMGDLFRKTKNVSPGDYNRRNFTLLGDPAIRLAYPTNRVVTTSVNSNPVSAVADTIQGLSKVIITGQVQDVNGQKLSSFNGVLYPTIFDKPSAITTLSNDGPQNSPPRTFQLQKNVLYKGKVSVVNGEFSFQFIVPKDISYQYGFGKISYYGHNGNTDAHGAFENVVIGGFDPLAVADNQGPAVKLYMNDDKFAFGGMTNDAPILYATITDSSGINTSGNSIGHDIASVMDDQSDKTLILNDFYQADLDSYQSGKVRYQLSKLSSGRHTVDIKVWDVHNNSSKDYTEFIVAESADLALSHVLNYPNPFTTHTSFFFEHNRPTSPLEVQVQVYTVSGKLIKTINQQITTAGFRSDQITWDGRDDFGDAIGRGVYVYRLRVRDGENSAEQFEKLVILK